jgi:hypothetical protein
MFYLQDSMGRPVSEARAAAICTTARGLFKHLRNQNMAPKSWRKRSDPAAQYFYRGMVKFEPNFMMAEDFWKLDRLATDIYFNWARPRKEGTDIKHEVEEHTKTRKRKLALSDEISSEGGKRPKKLESSLISSGRALKISFIFLSLIASFH